MTAHFFSIYNTVSKNSWVSWELGYGYFDVTGRTIRQYGAKYLASLHYRRGRKEKQTVTLRVFFSIALHSVIKEDVDRDYTNALYMLGSRLR